VKSAKEIWDVLKTAHKGDEVTKITKRETIEGELGRFMLHQGEVKGKCAFGPFLSILVIECKHKCLNVKICPRMIKVQITS
jgi:hypothetical protein